MNHEEQTKQQNRSWTGTQILLVIVTLISITIGIVYVINIQNSSVHTNDNPKTDTNIISPSSEPSPTQQSTRNTFIPPSEAADESTSNAAIAGITTEQANKAKELISLYGNWKGNSQEPKDLKNQTLQNNFTQAPRISPNDYWTGLAQKYAVPLDSLTAQTSFNFSQNAPSISSEDNENITLNIVASTSISNPDTSKTLTGTWVVTMNKSSLQGISLIPPAF